MIGVTLLAGGKGASQHHALGAAVCLYPAGELLLEPLEPLEAAGGQNKDMDMDGDADVHMTVVD